MRRSRPTLKTTNRAAVLLIETDSISLIGPRAGVPRLLAPVPPGLWRRILGIVEVIGAVVQGLLFRASSEEIGLELPLLPFEVFHLLLQGRDAEQGIAMATLPESDLLAELEVLALQSLELGAQPGHFLA
jgi:hypothetical protein